jgi:hypothetical protein
MEIVATYHSTQGTATVQKGYNSIQENIKRLHELGKEVERMLIKFVKKEKASTFVAIDSDILSC